MKRLIILYSLTLFPITQTMAEDLDKDPLQNVKISKTQIEQSLLAMKDAGKISEADYQKAMKDLQGINQNNIKSLTDKAVDLIRKDPDKAVEIYQAKKLDPEKVKELQNSKPLSD